MRSFSFVVALLFAFVTTSFAWPDAFPVLEARKGHKNGTANGNGNGNSVNKACRQMAKLTKLTELAANQTKLDAMVAKGKLNTTEVDDIKAKAQQATTELQAMQANTTLTTECAVIDAHRKVVSSCKKINKLQKLADMANNQTAKDALVAKKKLNDTQVAKLDERIANATTKLQEMKSNTTLTDLCAQENQQKGTNGGASASGSGTSDAQPAASTGGAATLATETLPFIAGVGAIFALFL